MIKKYIKKPIIVEAIEFKGTNWWECECFIEDANITIANPTPYKEKLHIPTIDGIMTISVGQIIIKYSKGNIKITSKESFKELYEENTNE